MLDDVIYSQVMEGWDFVIATYADKSRSFDLIINRYTSDGEWHGDVEKDNETLSIVNVTGRDLYLFENMGSLCADWHEYPYQVSISGDLTVEERNTLVNSIQRLNASSLLSIRYNILLALTAIGIVILTHHGINIHKRRRDINEHP